MDGYNNRQCATCHIYNIYSICICYVCLGHGSYRMVICFFFNNFSIFIFVFGLVLGLGRFSIIIDDERNSNHKLNLCVKNESQIIQILLPSHNNKRNKWKNKMFKQNNGISILCARKPRTLPKIKFFFFVYFSLNLFCVTFAL